MGFVSLTPDQHNQLLLNEAIELIRHTVQFGESFELLDKMNEFLDKAGDPS